MANKCICGQTFGTYWDLEVHMRRFCGQPEAAESAKTADSKASKRARSMIYANRMRHQVAMDLAQLCLVKLVPAPHVDITKGYVTKWLVSAADAIMADVNDDLQDTGSRAVLSRVLASAEAFVRSKLDLFDGLRTEYLAAKYLQKHVPTVKPVRRVMPPRVVDEADRDEDDPIFAMLKAKELVAHLQVRCVVKFEAAHLLLADACRGRAEAERASNTSPIKIGIMLYADAFTPVDARHGQAHSHSVLAVMFCFLNLKPSMRLAIPAIQLATLNKYTTGNTTCYT
eukprot:1202754-Pleurochrysis_carterae.AAC.3